jgi:hypothetical protein
MADSTADIHGFKISLADSLLYASKGPREWMEEASNGKEVMFSTLSKPIRAGDKEYFLLKVNGPKPTVEWAVYGSDNNELARGSLVPYSK